MSNFNNPLQPSTLDDFAISSASSKLQLESIANGTVPFPMFQHAICLWGTYGTGKTTLAELLPKLLESTGNLRQSSRAESFFSSQDYWQLTGCGFGSNAVEMMQDIKKRAQSDVFASPKGWFYEILDEVDNLTPAAQASLKSMIGSVSTIFVMTTNNPHKLDKGLIDRSLMIEMNQPKPAEMEPVARRLLQKMGLTGNEVDSATLHQLAVASKGSMRSFAAAVSILGVEHGGVI